METETKYTFWEAFFNYWKILIRWSLGKTLGLFDMKSRLKEAISWLLVLAILAVPFGSFVLHWIPSTILEDVRQNAVSSLYLMAAIIGATVIEVVIIFVIRLVVIEPVNIHKKQMEVINDYIEKERLINSEFIYFDIVKGTDMRGSWVGISVSNDARNTILRDLIFTVETIESVGSGLLSDFHNPIPLHMRGYGDQNTLNYLSPGGAPSLFNLAITVTNTLDGGAIKTKITKNGIARGSGIFHLASGTYKIKTRLIGSFYTSLDMMNPRDEYWVLTVGDDNSLNLRKAD
jgi:hypothetical protein